MNNYIELYFDLLINSNDINEVKNLLPSITLDKTNIILNTLIEKIEKEMQAAEEFEDVEYLSYLKEVKSLIDKAKTEEKDEKSILQSENIIIFSDNVLKSLRKLNDSFYYNESASAIEFLRSKQWMENNKNNSEKYKRLHGDAYGLSEVKMKKIRLMHMPINGDIWFVSDILKKDGDNPKVHRLFLSSLANSTKAEVESIRARFTINNQLDYNSLIEYAKENNKFIMEELMRFGGKKR